MRITSSKRIQHSNGVEYPTVVVKDINIGQSPTAAISRLDSLNLNSVLMTDTRESFLKSNDTYDNFQDPVIVENDDGKNVKISFTVPKLAALLTRNSTEVSPRQMRKILAGPTGKYYQHLVLENDPAELDEQYRKTHYQEDMNDSPVVSPAAKKVAFNTRAASNSPRPERKSGSKTAPEESRPQPQLPPQPNIVYNYNPFSSNPAVTSAPVPKRNATYVDPLTQEKTIVNEQTKQTIQENKSLKDLLVDALEDFYDRHENMKSEKDVAVLEKVGVHATEVKQFHELASTQNSNNPNNFFGIPRKAPPVQPNLVTVLVSASNNSQKNQNIVATAILPNEEPRILRPQTHFNEFNRDQNSSPLVYEVKQMFEEDEVQQQTKGKKVARDQPHSHEASHNKNDKFNWQNRKRPSSAGAMISDLKYQIQKKDRFPVRGRPTEKVSKKDQQPFFEPPADEPMDEEKGAEQPPSEDLFINSKPYTSHPLHQFRQLSDREKQLQKNEEIRMKQEQLLRSREASPEPPANRQLTSPRTTTIMLLSHDIVTRNERRSPSPPPPGLTIHNLPLTGLNTKYDVPISIVSARDQVRPTSAASKLQGGGYHMTDEQVLAEIHTMRNRQRLRHIVQNELLLQKELGENAPPEDTATKKGKEEIKVPQELTEQVKKQLNHYNEITTQKIQQAHPQATVQRPASAHFRHADTTNKNNNTDPKATLVNAPTSSVFSDSNQVSPRGLPASTSIARSSGEGQVFPELSTVTGVKEESTIFPKIQWKGFVNNIPPEVAPLDLEKLHQMQEANPLIVINGRVFKNIHKVSLEAPTSPQNRSNSPVLGRSSPTGEVNNNNANDNNNNHQHSHKELPQHPNQYLHNLQYYVKKANQGLLGNNNNGLGQQPSQLMIQQKINPNKPPKTSARQQATSSSPAQPASIPADEIDHDFMNIQDDIYINDHLYFADRFHNHHHLHPANRKILDDPPAPTAQRLPISQDGGIVVAGPIFDKQHETVRLNKNIVSDRIDKKHLEGFNFARNITGTNSPRQQSPLPIPEEYRPNYEEEHRLRSSRPISASSTKRNDKKSSKKFKVRDLKIDSNKMPLATKMPVIRPVPIIPASSASKQKQLQKQQQEQEQEQEQEQQGIQQQPSEDPLQPRGSPGSPSDDTRFSWNDTTTLDGHRSPQKMVQTPMLRPAPPPTALADRSDSMSQSRQLSVDGKGVDLLEERTVLSSSGPNSRPLSANPSRPTSAVPSSRPISATFVNNSRPGSAAYSSKGSSRPTSASANRKIVTFSSNSRRNSKDYE